MSGRRGVLALRVLCNTRQPAVRSQAVRVLRGSVWSSRRVVATPSTKRILKILAEVQSG